MQGQIDCSLSEKRIKDTIKMLENFPTDFDICFCSLLKRAKQTAKILVPKLNIIYDERLIEIGLGDWENTIISNEKQNLLNSSDTILAMYVSKIEINNIRRLDVKV